MFLHRLPIPVENTLTQLSKPHAPTHTRSQTRCSFFPRPLFPSSQSHMTALHSPNVAAVSGSWPEPEPLPPMLRPDLMPKQVAVIMEGNGRWAKMRGLPASAGHEAGVQSLRRIIVLCCGWGIKVLTVFAFSHDNWVRPKVEVDFLLMLFERTIGSQIETFKRDGIQISVIGDTTKLPATLQRMISNAEEKTKQNSRLQLIIAINYSGKYDVVQACMTIAGKTTNGVVEVEDINESLVEQELETKCTEFPNPDLMIRTSGELRVSNFLLWQMAYTELFFNPQLWPDFGKEQFVEALVSFQQRQRRFGGRHS
ncbi:cis-prenyltransferase 4, chloroplastic-like [Prosopis cineraria]|uniref:cis-prenyltransferase 4, chloroplastic-like n=1 Tax=Prosopis cineraria TaxID=364024 RepID=UPI00240F69A5|nr:cis-prenyltransferase 4, chloroplastic-like [Prosopis cineraria]